MNRFDEIFTKVDEKLESFVHTLLEHIPDPEPGPFKTSKQLKEEYRHTLTDLFKGKEIKERIKRGVEVIRRELSMHESPSVIQRIEQEWESGLKSFAEKLKQGLSSEEGVPPPGLQELFNISDESIEQLYQCGLREYQHGHAQEAADVFYILSLLDYRRPNVWIALGLAEQKLHRNEPALIAFEMAALTDPENPLSFLHAAECYLSLGEKGEAKDRLESASALLRGRTDAESQSIQDRIASLKNRV